MPSQDKTTASTMSRRPTFAILVRICGQALLNMAVFAGEEAGSLEGGGAYGEDTGRTAALRPAPRAIRERATPRMVCFRRHGLQMLAEPAKVRWDWRRCVGRHG
ncbi:hypothetical protein [Streptomyces coeruleorubidus]|uniref:hypothetical protein n=1 Tax=Streptomyces coeruleorubidus TaxID=116188 RepID=UPI0034010772